MVLIGHGQCFTRAPIRNRGLHWIWLEIVPFGWIRIATTRLIGATLFTRLGHFEAGRFHQLGNTFVWNFFPFATA
jgi:hypothetical protein